MQALKSLFSRVQAQRAVVVPEAQTAQPIELSAESLKLVGGGLPRIGGGATVPTEASTSTSLPSVS